MPGTESYQRLAWTDRFQSPDAGMLREALHGHGRHQFDAVRKRLLELDAVSESPVWYGDCWKWSIEYRTPLSKPPGDPLTVLIPCPEDLQLALPIDREFIESLSVKRMKRAVRDGLELAREPFDTRWSVWSIGGAAGHGLLDDLQDLIESKLKHLAKRAG